jgi:di/tricarboxylate transporter
MSDATLTLLILLAVVVLFVWNRWPVEIVAVGSALVLYFTGILELPEALAGFADPAVVLIAALFVVSEGLDATGVTTWVGQRLAVFGRRPRRLLLVTMLMSAGLTSLIGLNGAVAALLPMVIVVALRESLIPSRLLMPLAFAGGAGGLLLLTGSPVNVVISQAAADAGVGRFAFFEFAVVGLPLVVSTLLIVLALGDRLLPERTSDEVPPDLSRHARTLVRQYSLENVVHLRVRRTSPLVGTPRSGRDLFGDPEVRVITVLDGATSRPSSEGLLAAGDRITLVGDPERACRHAAEQQLDVERVRTGAEIARSLLSPDMGAVEVVIPPRSSYVGRTVHPSQVIRGSVVVLAVERRGEDQGSAAVELQAGDTLLLEGPWEALNAAAVERDVLVVDSPDLVRRQAVALGRGARPAALVLLGMVVLLATGLVPAVTAALLAAGAMVLLRAVTVTQAYRGISWTTVLLVAGMIPMATAVRTSGAGEQVASLIVDLVGGAGPVALLAALFAITVAFGQLISNTATALIMIPIAVSAAEQLDVSARPVLMSLCVGAAVAFLTPISTPANMMVMGPAGYRFGDYWRLGLPVTVPFFLVAVFLVPLVWQF